MTRENNWQMIWPERRYVSDTLLVTWAEDAIANGDCEIDPPPTIAQLQCDTNLARRIVEDAGYVTFRATLREVRR